LEAERALRDFDKLLQSKPTLADVTDRWQALLALACLRLPAKLLSSHFDSVEQLEWWWREGGEDYLRAHISIDERTAHLPPEPRRLLAKVVDKPKVEIPGSLVCSDRATNCDPDAAEAMLAFEARDRSEARVRRSGCHDDPDTQRFCMTEARKLEARRRYPAFMHCMDYSAGTKAGRYPRGGLKLPRGGWLILGGRRGHYSFCDELRAYDLESGAAYVASSCGGLVLREHGQVDGAATAAATSLDVRNGRISADAIRRITFLLATKSLVRQERVAVTTLKLPQGMRQIWWDKDGTLFGMFGRGCGGWGHSGQNSITWTWRDGERVMASGTFQWPESADPIDDAVDEMLRMAEAAWTQGCPPRALPSEILDVVGVTESDRATERRLMLERKLRETIGRGRGSECSPSAAPAVPLDAKP
jgi:hypothetical protein